MAQRRRGRPSKDRHKTNIYVDADVLAELEIYLIDPVKGKLQYGSLSTLCNILLRQFLAHLRKPDVDPQKLFAAYGIDIISDPEEQEDTSDAT